MLTYKVSKYAPNTYSFVTKNKVNYYLIFKQSGIVFQSINYKNINVLELSLVYKAGEEKPFKDDKTIRTLISFFKTYFKYFDAVYFQTHNQIEKLNNLKKRRGLLRVMLWQRIMDQHFNDIILFSNIDQNEKEDIPCLFVKKNSVNVEQIKLGFYKFIKT